MNQKLIIGIAVLGLIYIFKTRPKTQATARTSEIIYGEPNGWRYFSDGTAIGPSGEYYKNGDFVWSPSMP